MRITVLLLTILFAVAFVGSAFAVPAGKTVEFAAELAARSHLTARSMLTKV